MTITVREMRRLAWAAAAAPLPVLFTACGDGDAGLTRSEVVEIARAEMAESPAPATGEPGITSGDVEEAIRRAMAEAPQPEAGLAENEVEEIVKAIIRC